MSILSIYFVLFVAIAVLIYYLISFTKLKKYQWAVLLVGSYLFYVLVNWTYAFFLLGITVLVYLFTLLIGKLKPKNIENENQEKKNRILLRVILVLGIICIVASLLVVKYTNFVFSNIYSLFLNSSFTSISFIVPLGISFYTFQSIAYLVDVYKGKVTSEKNFFKVALFLSFFPQIVEGPISRYSDLAPQLYGEHDLDADNIRNGTIRIIFGYFKKIVIADMIALIVDPIFDNYSQYTGPIFILAFILYAVQIYADFSGFMDIALGVGTLFGIKLPENFNQPYLSTSVGEFYRRWHMTLGSWLRDYIYIPLGGNRVGKVRQVINIMVVWIVSGLWHGASYHYIAWGLYFGVLISLSALLQPVFKKINQKLKIKEESLGWRIFRIARTCILVTIGWVFFRADSLTQARYMLIHCLDFSAIGLLFDGTLLSLGFDWFVFVIIGVGLAIWYFFSNPVLEKHQLYSLGFSNGVINVNATLIIFVILCWGIIASYLYQLSLGNVSSSFIYFEF